MVQFARPRKYEAPANRLLPGGGMRGVGELPGGLGDGTPLPMPGGMPNPAVGPRGQNKGNRRYMGGGGAGGGAGGGGGGYATQGYDSQGFDSQRSQGYPSQDGYGMHSTQQSLGGLSLDSSQPGYASQGYDAQAHAARRTPRAARRAPHHAPHHAPRHAPRPHCAALRRTAPASRPRLTPHRAVTVGGRMLRRATTAPNRTRSRTERPSRRATREAASRSHKTRRATPSPPTRKTTPATAAPMTMARRTWPTTTARQHRSRGRTRRARERLSPHPLSCLLHHWPAVLCDGSGHVGDDGGLRRHTR